MVIWAGVRGLLPVFSFPGLALLSPLPQCRPQHVQKLARAPGGLDQPWQSSAGSPSLLTAARVLGPGVLRVPKALWADGTARGTCPSWGVSQEVPGTSGAPTPPMSSPSLHMPCFHPCPRVVL